MLESCVVIKVMAQDFCYFQFWFVLVGVEEGVKPERDDRKKNTWKKKNWKHRIRIRGDKSEWNTGLLPLAIGKGISFCWDKINRREESENTGNYLRQWRDGNVCISCIALKIFRDYLFIILRGTVNCMAELHIQVSSKELKLVIYIDTLYIIVYLSIYIDIYRNIDNWPQY